METSEDEIEVILDASFDDIKGRFEEVCRLWTSKFACQPKMERKLIRLMPKLVKFFNNCLQNIQTASDSKSTLDDYLQEDLLCTVGVLNCIQSCHNNWPSSKDILTVNVACLFDATCEVILKTCRHYADRNTIYKQVVSQFQKRLDEMYFCTVNVINIFISTLGLWKANFNMEKDCVLLISVCEAISDICKIVGSFDIKTTISLWKLYMKFMTQHCDYIKDRIDVAKAINALCSEIIRDVSYLTNIICKEDEKDAIKTCQKTIRLSGFCLKMVVKLCDLYKNYLGNCVENIIQLLLHLCRFSPPSLCCHKLPKILASDAEVQLTMAIEPLVGHLLSERQFAACLFGMVTDPPDTFQFSLCNLLVIVLDSVFLYEEDVQDLWMNKSEISILESFFHMIPYCYAELSLPVYLPGVMLNGKPQRLISLYEHFCTKLCGFITCLPAKYFTNLEHILLDNVLSDNVWLTFIASDAWAYLARLESAELCFHHCWHLASLAADIEMCGNVQSVMLAGLVNRMARFLDSDHKTKLLMKFPNLVSNLEEESLTDPEMNVVHQHIMSQKCLLLNDIELFCQKKPSSGVALYELMKRLIILHPTVTSISNNEMELVLVFWEILPWNSFHKSITAAAVGIILEIVSASWDAISSDRCLKFLMDLNDRFPTATESFYISIIAFLGTFSNKVFQPCYEQNRIFGGVAQLLSMVLNQKNSLVHQFALEMFAKFACGTVHEEIIPICMKNIHWLKPEICNYLSKIPYKVDGKLDLRLEYQTRSSTANRSTCIKVENVELCLENYIKVEEGQPEEQQHVPDIEIVSILGTIEEEIYKLEALTIPGKLTPSQQELIQILSSKLSHIVIDNK